MEESKVGDVVKLKSESPRMTVEDTDWDGKIRCVWFEGGKSQTALFPKETLEKDLGNVNLGIG